MGWLQKLPIVSLLLIVAFVAVPLRLASDHERANGLFESARDDARTFLIRNPQLEVDTLGSLILDPTWLDEMRSAAANGDSGVQIELPARLLARSQANLDSLIADAYALRISGDPTWRFGVLDVGSPAKNYIAHAFVHDELTGVLLSIAVLLLVGIALELTWGPLIYSAFILVAIPITAQGYRLFDASSGIPWSGGAGLAGALIGAYFIRGLGGHFFVPGWILLPIWLGVESFVVRDLWLDDLGVVPWATICAAVAFGALVAGALRLANLESNLDTRAANRTKRGPNPVVSRAARLRSDGDPYQAFDLIQAAWRDDPKNEEIIEAFFAIAVEVGQPEAAAEAIVPSLGKALRSGKVGRAVDYWFPLANKKCEVTLEATVAVRLGEALLDAGHPQEALFTLRGALTAGVSAAQATRIVNVARDLDDGLARRAASIALNDVTLDLQIRAELEAVATIPNDSPPNEKFSPTAPLSEPASLASIDARIEPEHRSTETTAFPIDADSNVASTDEAARGASDPNEASLQAQALDTGAFSAGNLSAEGVSTANAESSDTVLIAGTGSDGTLSGWNERDPLAMDIAADLGDDFDEEFADETDEVLLDPLGSGIDLDLTPVIDATDESTIPLVQSKSIASERTTVAFEDETMLPASAGSGAEATEIFSIGVPDESRTQANATLRSIKVLDAVPITMNAEWVEIDAAPRGKSKLPFSRIQTISMVAVNGLGPRPVLIVDVLLSGSDGIHAPMKLVRFRSDRFDPLAFEPAAASPLAALTSWVKRLQIGSDAICLPSRGILVGKFERFDTLEAYERQVLGAVRENES